jgi:hypothetical protein
VARKIITQILVAIFCGSSAVSFAQQAKPNNTIFYKIYKLEVDRRIKRQDTDIYKRTIRLCKDSFIESGKLVFGGAWSIFRMGLSSDEATTKKIIENRGFSDRLGEMLRSEAFYDAVEECYPGNYGNQVLFLSALITDDIGGKIFGGIGAYYVGLGIYKTFELLGEAIGLSQKSMKIIKWTSTGLSMTSAAAKALHDYYMYRQEREKAARVSDLYKELQKQNIANFDRDIAGDNARLSNSNLLADERKLLEDDVLALQRLRQKAFRP